MESIEEQQKAPESEGGSAAKEKKEELGYDEMVALYDESMRHLTEGEIVSGKVIDVTDDFVVVDVGYKSEGLVPIEEFTSYDGEVRVEVG